MTRGQRIAVRIGIGLGSVLLLLLLVLLVLTGTDPGREQVRRFAVGQLNAALDGTVEIGRLEGNLLRRWRLVDVSVTDAQGRPFVAADTIATRFSLRSLLHRHIILHDVLLARATVILDQPPGEKWNFARILPEPDPDPTQPGWGERVLFRDVTILRSRITIRSEWRPDEGLSPGERQRKIAEALDDGSRANIQRVTGGFQNVMDFRDIDARLSEVVLADPEVDRTVVDVAALRAIAQPYRPPVADVRDLAGRFHISGDSIWFPDVRARLPGSAITGRGVYHLATADLQLRLRGTPAAFEDLRWLYPQLPEEGGGDLRLSVDRRQTATRIVAEEMDVRVSEGTLAGDLRLMVGDTFRILPTDLRFSRLDTRPVVRMIPGVELPRHGILDGHLALRGDPEALAVDGDVRFTDARSGQSRILARGTLGVADDVRFSGITFTFQPLQADLLRPDVPELPAGAAIVGTLQLDGSIAGVLNVDGDLLVSDPATGDSRVAARGGLDLADEVVFRRLAVRFDPLQVPLLAPFAPDLPVGGTLEGTATLDGRPGSRLAVQGDLVHREAGETSRVAGAVELDGGSQARADLRLLPLSLVTAGRLAPEAQLRGEARGALRAAGSLADLTLAADLTVTGGGAIQADGWLDLASAQPGYALDARLRDFDVAAMTAASPAATDLTGTVDARGRGVDIATLSATVRADLVGPAVNGVAADEVRLRAAIADGLARVDSSTVRVGAAEAWADGDFGLVAGRDGELRFRVHLDSLAVAAPYLATDDTAVVPVRPLPRREALAEARAEAERAERRRLVELIATGRAPPPEPVDTLVLETVARDTVAGRLDAAGVLRGNVESMDVEGRAAAESLALRGQYVERGRAEFAWLRRHRPEPIIELDAEASGLVLEGFALDSVRTTVRHRGDRAGSGDAELVVWQDHDTDYRAEVDFTIAPDRAEVLLRDVTLRFDTLTWRSARPGRVQWADGDVEVDDIELVGDRGGLIYLDGVLPVEGAADLHVILREVELAHMGLLLQDDADMAGRLSLEARVEGTARAPRLEGVAIVADGARNGQRVPDLRAVFAYADQALTVDGELFDEGRVFASVDADLPLDLALGPTNGPRLVDGPLVVDVQADSLPLDGLSALTEAVSEADGILAGEFSIRGSWDAPVLAGEADVRSAGFRLEGTGVRYHDVAGALRLEGSTLTVDSLVARAGGPVRVTGEIDLSTLTEPGFDLNVTASNAWAIRTDDLQLRVDADLEVSGPFDRVVVTGDARTRRGVIYIPEARDKHLVALDEPELFEALEGRLLERAEEVLDMPSPLLANLEVDVNLHIAPDTWIRSLDFNVEVYTPAELGPLHVQLDQRAGRLSVEGTVNSDRGDYTFMGRRFRVTRGAATFVGAAEPDPILQVAAEHEVEMPGREGFSMRVIVGGTALEPTLTLESDARPPIAETDLFTYVAFGRSAGALLQQQGSALSGQGGPAGELVGNVAGMATVQMAAVAANTVLDEFERETARELGIDVFNIAPADLPSELFSGRFADFVRGTEIEAGRYIGPRLFAAVRARPTTETRPGATLEYSTPGGFRFRTSLDPRYLPSEPTLRDVDPERTSVFGAFLFREWRF
jgi:translocation and assembly module TamB